VTVEQRVQALVAVRIGHRASREAEREDEEVDRGGDVGDPHLQLTEIHLRLLPRPVSKRIVARDAHCRVARSGWSARWTC